ncbi:unnamed protein product [Prunus armeniaca]
MNRSDEAISSDFQPLSEQDTKSDYSDSPRACEGESASESSTAELESADFEGTEVRGGIEVSTDSRSTSSLVVVEVDGSQSSTSDRRCRLPIMEKAFRLLLPVDKLNALKEAELAKIRVEYHMPDLVMMRIPGLLESLSDPEGEVVFFTDVFKHGLWLPLRHTVQKILAQIGYSPRQFNLNF